MNILFRADGNSTIGAGHIMRCLALAQALKDCGGNPVFLCSDLAEGFKERLNGVATVENLKAEAYTQDDAVETAATAKNIGAEWIVLDGYNFDDAYVTSLKDSGVQVLRLDDHSHLSSYSADFILNQNAHAAANQYPNIAQDTKLLLGCSYTMLQRAFRNSSPQAGVPITAKKILITLGGSDPENVTPMVIRALKGLEVELTVIVGGGNPHIDDVQNAISDTGLPAEIVVNANNMHELMNTADLAITAAGSTCYELAYMGVPMITIIVADNQVGVAEGLSSKNACVNLGWNTELTEQSIADTVANLLGDEAKRKALQDAGKSVIDGSGAFRVLMQMNESPLYLRQANDDDCEIIFKWANDADTRAASFSSEQIPWEDHTKWYTEKLADANHLFFVGMNSADEPVGQVRFDTEGDTAMISVSVAPEMRGKKYATPLIAEGCKRCFGQTNAQMIDAFIKPENEASKAVFTKAGFTEQDPSDVNGNAALHFTLKR